VTSPRGILAIFNNVAAGRDADFDGWFQGEHLAERLAVPGFLYGRRHKSVSGGAGYFNFYVTESPEVLSSKAYLDRIDSPTPRSRMIMSEVFRDMCRTACRRDLRVGAARGAFAVTARFFQPHDLAALTGALRELANDETIGGEVWSAAEKPGVIKEEEKLRGGDAKIAHCLMVDVLHRDAAEAVAKRLAADFAKAEIGVFQALSHQGDSSA